MPFSTFVRNVRQNEVLAVAIDRRALRTGCGPRRAQDVPKSAGQLPAGAAVLLRTLRPGLRDALRRDAEERRAVQRGREAAEHAHDRLGARPPDATDGVNVQV